MKPLAQDVPFAPARAPFFYGWVVVAAATLGVMMSIPGQTMGVSVFTDHLIEATGLSRLELSFAYLIGTVASAALLPRGGVLLDRLGARVTAMGACVALALTLVGLSGVDLVARDLASRLGLANELLLTSILLTIGLSCLRFSGQGMLTMSSRTMMAKWFERRRGLASGISGVFVAFGFASAPQLLQVLIDAAGWRGAWQLMALAIGLGTTLMAWIFYRDNPDACGLTMDGRPAHAEPSEAGEPGETEEPGEAEAGAEAGRLGEAEEPAYTRAQALRTAGFWFVTLSLTLQAMIFTGVTFHIMDLGAEAGIGGRAAVELFLPIAAVGTVAGLLSGWAADRVSARALVLTLAVAQVAGFVGASELGAPGRSLLMVTGWGVGIGLYATLLNTAVPNFFGRRHLGAIASVQVSCVTLGSALGPAFLATSKAMLGSYLIGLKIACVGAGAVFIFAALAPLPKPHPDDGPD